jgi:ParB-like chromosome segregation protein Spo0J
MDTPLFERQQPVLREVKLEEVAPWSTSGARSATSKAIAALGFTSAVLLRQLPGGQQHKYSVVDGAGRLESAREQELETVPALVLGADVSRVEVAALRATMNLARRPNQMQEAAAIERLFDDCRADGLNEAEIGGFIAKTLGIPASVVRQRLNLLSLCPALRQGVEMGKVARGVAAKIANLPRAQQEQLVTELQERGKLTGHDVKEVRRVKQEAVLAELPDNLFAPLDDPKERARVMLKDFLDEGVRADELVAIIQQLESERTVF